MVGIWAEIGPRTSQIQKRVQPIQPQHWFLCSSGSPTSLSLFLSLYICVCIYVRMMAAELPASPIFMHIIKIALFVQLSVWNIFRITKWIFMKSGFLRVLWKSVEPFQFAFRLDNFNQVLLNMQSCLYFCTHAHLHPSFACV